MPRSLHYVPRKARHSGRDDKPWDTANGMGVSYDGVGRWLRRDCRAEWARWAA